MNQYSILQEHYSNEKILLQESFYSDISDKIKNMSINSMKKEINTSKIDAYQKIKKIKNHDNIINDSIKKLKKSMTSISSNDISSSAIKQHINKTKNVVEEEMKKYGVVNYIDDLAGAFLIVVIGSMIVTKFIIDTYLAGGIILFLMFISFIYIIVSTVKITWGVEVKK